MESDSEVDIKQDAVLSHVRCKKNNSALRKKKSNRAPPNAVRIFWHRLKNYLQNRPEVYGSSIFKSLSKLKDVPIKKLKNLIFEFKSEKEVVKKMYQEILEIFKHDTSFETEYPKYTQKLTTWFQNVLQATLKKEEEEEEEEIVKKEEEEDILPFTSLEESNSFISGTEMVTIPVWYLMGLQNQILYLSSSRLKDDDDPVLK
jgi:hypothetical protein